MLNTDTDGQMLFEIKFEERNLFVIKNCYVVSMMRKGESSLQLESL